MDGKIKAERKKNPREGANPLKILTFTFTLPTFWLGYRRDLEISDLYKPLKEHTSNHLGAKISKVWQKEYDAYVKEKRLIEEKEDHEKYHGKTRLKEPSLSKTLIKCFGPQIMLYGIILAVLEITLRLSQPIFLGLLIRYYSRTIAEPIPLHTAMTRIDNSSDSQVHEIEDAIKPLSHL